MKIPKPFKNLSVIALPVADPGFPVGGGVDLVGGGVDSQGGYVSKILYVKTKELGPLGGARARHAPPRSANVYSGGSRISRTGVDPIGGH